MKKLFAAAAAASILAMSVGPALADTYQGTAQRVGAGWSMQWNGVTPSCNVQNLAAAANKPTIATVDGVEFSLTFLIATQSFQAHAIEYAPSPDGNLTSVKIDGQASFQCGPHTFLLPGYVAPTAVPTLSEWAMILFGTILAGGAALYIHRRRVGAV